MYELYYLFGLWKNIRGKNGVSILTRSIKKQKLFIIAAKKLGQEKFIRKENEVVFYNSKILKMLKKIEEKEEKIFKQKDSKTREFLRGLYDGCAFERNGRIYLKMTLKDAVVLNRLGFKILEDKFGFYLFSPEEFMQFIGY